MQFDYDSIRQRMLSSLQAKVSWASVLEFSSSAKFLEVIAKELSELSNFDVYLTRENQWGIAKNVSSLLSASEILTYSVHRKIGSKGYLTISPSASFNGSYGRTIFIPKFSIFSSSEDASIKFCNTENTSIPIGTTSITLAVIQGTPKSSTQVAIGSNYEEILVVNSSVEDTFHEVYVNGALWTQIDNILNAGPTDMVYEVRNLYNFGGVKLKFGNNVFGKKLVTGDTVLFNYIETLGGSGNIARTNVVTVVESTIYDDTPTPVTVYCKNTGTFDGGDDVESTESVRVNAPKLFQTGNRAITRDDYIVILKDSGLVYKLNVWGEYEYLIDNKYVPGDDTAFVPLEENKIHIAGIKNTGAILDDTDKENIIVYLNDYKSPTDIVQFNDPEVIYLYFISTAYVKDRSYSLTTLKRQILDTLSTTYSFQNFEFGTNIYETDYKTLIDNIEGVDHNYTLVRLYNILAFDQANSSSFNLSLYPILPTAGQNVSVKVYLKGPSTDYFQIGQDDGSGSIVGLTVNGVTYDLTGSTIDYAVGSGFVQITSPAISYLTYSLKVEYALTSTDFILTNRAQIFRYGEAEVTCLYMQ